MKTRVITAIIMLSIIIPVLFIKNQIPFELLGSIFVIGATFEYIRLTKVSKIYYGTNLLAYGAFLMYVNPDMVSEYILPIKLVLGTFVLFALLIVIKDPSLKKWFNPIANTFYIGFGIANLIVLNQIGTYMLVYLILVITMTDTFALLFGVRFGKHKLAPTISPKKSVEGSIAGAIFGTILGTIYLLVMNTYFDSLVSMNIVFIVMMSFTVSTVGQFGDLFASKIKRFYKIKDFGNFFPGHGGILDRFDSLLLSGLILLLLIY